LSVRYLFNHSSFHVLRYKKFRDAKLISHRSIEEKRAIFGHSSSFQSSPVAFPVIAAITTTVITTEVEGQEDIEVKETKKSKKEKKEKPQQEMESEETEKQKKKKDKKRKREE
jgi:Skp family chaperone for outer membrane proteins